MAELIMRTFKFRVEITDGPEGIDNTLLGQFSEVSGFDVSYDPIEYKAGDRNRGRGILIVLRS